MTGPSWWRRVQALRSTAAGGRPRRSTSAWKISRSSPPLAPQRPSPGVAHTKICRTFATALILGGAPGINPVTLEGSRREPSLGALLHAPGTPTLLSLLCDRLGDCGRDALVEDARDDVVLGEFLLGYHVGDRPGRSELHVLVYLAGAHVQRSAEDAWEAQDVVDLVRVVAAARGDDPGVPQGLLGPYLRVGVGHREDQRVLVHGLQVLRRQHTRNREPEEEIRAPHCVREVAGPAVRVGVLSEPLLGRVEPLAPRVHDAPRVAADDVRGACLEHDLGARNPRGPDAANDDPEVLDLLAHDLERVYECGEDHYRRAVLVVVEDRDVELPLEPLLYLEAPRGRDVLKVYPAEGRCYVLDDSHDLVSNLGVEADGEGVHLGELPKEHRLALHYWHRRPRSDVAQAQDRRTVGDDRHRVALNG